MWIAASCLLAIAAGADLRLAGEAVVRTETRGRVIETGGLPTDTSREAEVGVRLGAEASYELVRATAAYSPRVNIIAREQVAARADVSHRLDAGAGWRASPRLDLAATAFGATGRERLAVGTGAATDPLQAVPGAGAVRFVQKGASVTATGNWRRVPSATLALAWREGGGADAESRAELPYQRTAAAAATVSVAVARRDVLQPAAWIELGALGDGPRDAIASLAATWRHQASRAVEAWAQAGGAAIASEVRGGATDVRAAPVAGAGFQWAARAAGHPLGTEVALRLAPTIDRYQATVDDRYDGAASVAWLPRRELTVDLRASAALARRAGAEDTRIVYFALRGVRRTGNAVDLTGSLWREWQDDPRTGVITQWGLLLGLTLTARTAR